MKTEEEAMLTGEGEAAALLVVVKHQKMCQQGTACVQHVNMHVNNVAFKIFKNLFCKTRPAFNSDSWFQYPYHMATCHHMTKVT